jgi:hypothetical protein
MIKYKKKYIFIMLLLGLVLPLMSANINAKASVLNTVANEKLNILQSATQRGGGIDSTDRFLSTNVLRSNVTWILFKDKLMSDQECQMQGGEKATQGSATDQDSGQINICSINQGREHNRYIYITANGKITLNKDSSYLFSKIGAFNVTKTGITINFNHAVIDNPQKTSMSHMFSCMGEENGDNVTIAGWGQGFGENTDDMSYMFEKMGARSSFMQYISIDDFPINFGKNITNASNMFEKMCYEANFAIFHADSSIQSDNGILEANVILPKFPAEFNANANMNNMFSNFMDRSINSVSVLIDLSHINFNISSVKQITKNMFSDFEYGKYKGWYQERVATLKIKCIPNLTSYFKSIYKGQIIDSCLISKMYAPVTKFSVIKNKTINFRYGISKNGKIIVKTKRIKYNTLGIKKLTIKSQNKRLRLTIKVSDHKILPKKPKIKLIHRGNFYFVKLKNKNFATYSMPKFDKMANNPLYEYGIYKNEPFFPVGNVAKALNIKGQYAGHNYKVIWNGHKISYSPTKYISATN